MKQNDKDAFLVIYGSYYNLDALKVQKQNSFQRAELTTLEGNPLFYPPQVFGRGGELCRAMYDGQQ